MWREEYQYQYLLIQHHSTVPVKKVCQLLVNSIWKVAVIDVVVHHWTMRTGSVCTENLWPRKCMLIVRLVGRCFSCQYFDAYSTSTIISCVLFYLYIFGPGCFNARKFSCSIKNVHYFKCAYCYGHARDSRLFKLGYCMFELLCSSSNNNINEPINLHLKLIYLTLCVKC